MEPDGTGQRLARLQLIIRDRQAASRLLRGSCSRFDSNWGDCDGAIFCEISMRFASFGEVVRALRLALGGNSAPSSFCDKVGGSAKSRCALGHDDFRRMRAPLRLLGAGSGKAWPLQERRRTGTPFRTPTRKNPGAPMTARPDERLKNSLQENRYKARNGRDQKATPCLGQQPTRMLFRTCCAFP
jgi:hypothetical protein